MLLAKALTALVSELERVGVEYAVVGGLAASARGEVRFTRDVDVAVATRNDADAQRLIYQLSRRGYSVSATVEQERTGRLATARLRNADHVVCDLIFATSGVSRGYSREQDLMEKWSQLKVSLGLRC